MASLVGLVVLAVAAGLLAFRQLRPITPTLVRFSGNKLFAEDGRGRLVWQYELPEGAHEATDGDLNQSIYLVDLNGDGRPEALVAVANCAEPTCSLIEHELYCFSPTGQLRWKYKPTMITQSPLHRYEGLWHFTKMLVTLRGSTKTIWLAVAHSNLWPSFVVRLDAAGGWRNFLINSGVVYTLSYLSSPSGAYLLAGGVNNEYDAGFLAVLKEDQITAVSPHKAGSQYEGRNSPPGHPYRYFLFPRTELNTLYGSAPYNKVASIQVVRNGLRIETHELYSAEAIYHLSEDFTIRSVDVSSGYLQWHERAERQREIDHSLAHCPERSKPRIIHEWTPDGLWHDVPVPWFGITRE